MSAQDREQVLQAAGPPNGDPLIGATLKGTYHVVRRIGEGGMGRVYEAEHVRLRRRVAIKVLLGQYSRHAEVIARFRREAEVVGSLGHPHIVQVVDVDETDAGEQFLVMEYLEGETLGERLAREPVVGLEEVVRLIKQVASALAGTHDKGIVHRDLKPENVFLVRMPGEKDFVKVLDFGISKVRSGGPKLTGHNEVIGTPAYMAPEQARPGVEVDHRADQFALAAMGYEMLAGQSPFPGADAAEVMQAILLCRPAPLRQVAPWVPEPVERVLMRGLSVKPDDRFTSVTALSRALDAAGMQAEAKPEPVPASKSTEPVPFDRRETLPRFDSREKATEPSPNKRIPSRPPPHASVPDSVRTPPPPGADHLVERLTPAKVARPASSPPERSRPSNPIPVRSSPLPARPSSPLPSKPGPSPSPPAPDRISSVPRVPGNGANVTGAEKLLAEARTAFADGRLDDAVSHAERLMELGVFGGNAAVFAVLRGAMPLIDRIFEARVGAPERKLSLTEPGRRREGLNLSSRAVRMLECVEKERTVQLVFAACDIPRRDAVRMLAGLMRRGLVE